MNNAMNGEMRLIADKTVHSTSVKAVMTATNKNAPTYLLNYLLKVA